MKAARIACKASICDTLPASVSSAPDGRSRANAMARGNHELHTGIHGHLSRDHMRADMAHASRCSRASPTQALCMCWVRRALSSDCLKTIGHYALPSRCPNSFCRVPARPSLKYTSLILFGHNVGSLSHILALCLHRRSMSIFCSARGTSRSLVCFSRHVFNCTLPSTMFPHRLCPSSSCASREPRLRARLSCTCTSGLTPRACHPI